MKKFVIAVFATLALVFTGVATAPIASAAPNVETAITTEVAATTPMVIGGAKPLYVLNNCHFDMWGNTWCYRSMCTYFDVVVLGCYSGWIKINRPWYA